MEHRPKQLKEMLAYEAFIRKASRLDMPFMLKGSYITRQYYDHPDDRIPVDLDWLCTQPLADVDEADKLLSEWATGVTEMAGNDGIEYTSFRKNRFWRMIDYAMADDFPTVNTDLSCTVDGEMIEYLNLDVSLNLDVEVPPVPLLYQPLRGEPFVIPFTAPLSLQVSWKIHQSLVRPRFKDLLDLIHLLKHSSWSQEMLGQSVQALVNECTADNVSLYRLRYLLMGDWDVLFAPKKSQDIWNYWRHDSYGDQNAGSLFVESAFLITDVTKLPGELSTFRQLLLSAFERSGWNLDLLTNLPKPNRTKRNRFDYGDYVTKNISIEERKTEESVAGNVTNATSLKPPRWQSFVSFWYNIFK